MAQQSASRPNGDLDLSIAISVETESEMLALILQHEEVLEDPALHKGLFGDATSQVIFEFLKDLQDGCHDPFSPQHILAHAKRIPGFWAKIDAPNRLVPLWNHLQLRDNYPHLLERLRVWLRKREALVQAWQIQAKVIHHIREDINTAALFRTASIQIDSLAPLQNPDLLKNGGNPIAVAKQELDQHAILLGNRFCSRQTACMIVAPTGVGKSVLAVQLMINWSAGIPCFGIAPKRPLRILIVQAEDDRNDMREMCQTLHRIPLTPEEETLVAKNANIQWVNGTSGKDFFSKVSELITALRGIDLLIINPLSAYLGTDPRDAAANCEFFRNHLTNLMSQFNFGTLLFHHTPKTQFQDYEHFSPIDLAYAGAGDAGISNFNRGIIQLFETPLPGTFKMIATKRAERIGWYGTDHIFISHSLQNDIPLWIASTQEQINTASASKGDHARKLKREATKNALLACLPTNGINDPVSLSFLLDKLAPVRKATVLELLELLIEQDLVAQSFLPKSSTNQGGAKKKGYAKILDDCSPPSF